MAADEIEPDETPAETKKLPEVDRSQYVVTPDPEAVAAASSKRTAEPSKGQLKPDTLSADYVVVTEPVPTEVIEPAAAATPTPAPVSAPTAAPTPAPSVVYQDAPVPPKKKGNRAFGVLIALAATVIFAVLFAFAVLLILRSIRGFATMSMLANYGYWIPVGVFLVAFLIVVLVINRAGWWAHIIGSFLVGAASYFAGAILITSVSVFGLHQVTSVQSALVSPTIIAAAIIAREVALWGGVIVSLRGRRVVQHNRDARDAFDTSVTPASHPEQASHAR